MRIDTSRPAALPGVHAVLTAADLPDVLVGRRMRDMPVLARDRVRFIGEKVAAVAADDPDIADEALALIDVEYEELPAVFDPVAAMEAGAPLDPRHRRRTRRAGASVPHSERPSVLRVERGDVEAGFARGRPRLRAHIPDAARSTRATSSRTPASSRSTTTVGPRLGVEQGAATCSRSYCRTRWAPAGAVDVNLLPLGGDFGGKGSLMDMPLAYYLARATGRPVKMVMTYAEELMAGNPRHPAVITLRTGLTRTGASSPGR